MLVKSARDCEAFEETLSKTIRNLEKERVFSKELYLECRDLLVEREQKQIKNDMDNNHLDTKNRLL